MAPEDSPGMFRLWSSEPVVRHSGPIIDIDGQPITMPARTPADSDKILAFWLQARNAGWGFRWALVLDKKDERDKRDKRDKADGFVGHIGFNSLGDCSEIAYHLHPDAWGKGYMSRAMSLALDWAFHRPECQVVEAFIEPENVASIRLVERYAFEPTSEIHDGARRHVLHSAVHHLADHSADHSGDQTNQTNNATPNTSR